jgi:hypothetical protein
LAFASMAGESGAGVWAWQEITSARHARRMAKNDELLLDLGFFMTGKINAPGKQMYTLASTRETQFFQISIGILQAN